LQALNRQTLAAALRRWRSDPVAFFREVLGFEPWHKQAELARAIARRKFVACRSGHKCGKTTALAAIALWFIVCFERSRVVMTAPAAPQIERGIWAEFKRLYAAAEKRGFPIGGTMNETPWTGLVLADGRDVFGRSTKTKENFAGISAPNLMILVDEASGIDEEIWEAVFGNAGGGAWVVAISNPTQLSGRFYEAFHGKRDHWELVHISSEETPNFHGGSVPGLATPEWAAMMRDEWGYPSVHYDVRVLGNFPSQAENSVIGFGLVEAGLERGRLLGAIARGELSREARAELGREQCDALESLILKPAPLELGVDVARFGDDSTVFVPARGLHMLAPKLLNSLDVLNVAGAAHAYARELAHSGEIPTLRVDANGIGAGVYDALKRRALIRAVEVNVSERARETTRYVRTRDELWFAMRSWLERGGCLPEDARLASELIAPTYSFDVKGRYQVESKADIKERIGRSPDTADAACLAIYKAQARKTSINELRKKLRGRRM
jgi:phage terminase large subunit